MKKLSLVLAVVIVSVLLASAGWAANAFGGVKITPMQALDIAFKHAGVDAGSTMDVSVELETWRGNLIYDVEFEVAGFEYDYKVDAMTGDVLRHRKERD